MDDLDGCFCSSPVPGQLGATSVISEVVDGVEGPDKSSNTAEKHRVNKMTHEETEANMMLAEEACSTDREGRGSPYAPELARLAKMLKEKRDNCYINPPNKPLSFPYTSK